MTPRTTLVLLVVAVVAYLLYLGSLARSPLTTSSSLESSAPPSGSVSPLGLVFRVDNPELDRARDFTIQPTPIQCTLVGIRPPPWLSLAGDGSPRLPQVDTNTVILVLTFGTDTTSVPQCGLQLVLHYRAFLERASGANRDAARFRSMVTSRFFQSSTDVDVSPLDVASVLDTARSDLADADSMAFNVFRAFVTPLRRPFMYPFDAYELDLVATISFDSEKSRREFAPPLNIICDRSGWTHTVSFPSRPKSTQSRSSVVFQRAPDVRIVSVLALVTLVLLVLAIPFQRDTGSVLEVSFSFLLGLWGIKSVIVPPSIRYPTIVDSALVGLFALFTFSVLLRLIVSPLVVGMRPMNRRLTVLWARGLEAGRGLARRLGRDVRARFNKRRETRKKRRRH